MSLISIQTWLFLLFILTLYYILKEGNQKIILLNLTSLIVLFKAGIISFIVALLVAGFSFYYGKYIEVKSRTRSGNFIFFTAVVICLIILFFFKEASIMADGLLKSNFTLQEISFQQKSLWFPIGLSFYVFSVISYFADIRLKRIKAEKKFQSYLNYIIFFPKLLAGPIERANCFLPQSLVDKKLIWENISEGGKLIIWGIFQKLVVADRIALFVNATYADIKQQTGITVFLTILLYTIQIYSDFSGYTNIARGTGKLFGYDLAENFKRPLLASGISDFWRRWHISLSSWVNDYVFKTGSMYLRKFGKAGVVTALFISFIFIGVWHGFLLTFLIFGIIHATLIGIELFSKDSITGTHIKSAFALTTIFKILITFLIISFTLILFRVQDLNAVSSIFESLLKPGEIRSVSASMVFFMVLGISILLMREVCFEYFSRDILKLNSEYFIIRSVPYVGLVMLILLAGVFDGNQFIYVRY